MQRQTKYVKNSLFAFHFVLALSGVALIATGAIILSLMSNYFYFMAYKIIGIPIIISATGGIVLIANCIGYRGTIKQNYELLTPFIVALVIAGIIELTIGITIATLKNDLESSMRKSMDKSIIEYQPYNKIEKKLQVKKAWHKIQHAFKCCGIDSPLDWVNATATYDPHRDQVPDSCCPNSGFAKPCSILEKSGDYKPVEKGCWETLSCSMKLGEVLLIGTGFGFAIIQIVGIVFVCYFMSAIKNESPRRNEMRRTDQNLDPSALKNNNNVYIDQSLYH